LPSYFSRIHPRYRTPHVTTIWTGIAVGGVAMFSDIGSLADLTNIGTLFAFILVCLGVIILRRTDAARPRPFRVPLVPWFPILGVIFCIALMLSLPVLTWIRFFVWLAIGLVVYFGYSVYHSRLRGDAVRVNRVALTAYYCSTLAIVSIFVSHWLPYLSDLRLIAQWVGLILGIVALVQLRRALGVAGRGLAITAIAMFGLHVLIRVFLFMFFNH